MGILQNNHIVFIRGYGYANAEKKEPVTTHTMFRWASISKTLTAVAAMQLVERHQLDLDADVRGYVPEFPDKGKPITTRQLLCHESGIPHYHNGKIVVTHVNYTVPHPFEDAVTALDFLQRVAAVVPARGPVFVFHLRLPAARRGHTARGQGTLRRADPRAARPAARTGTLRPDYQWLNIPIGPPATRSTAARWCLPATPT